MRSRQHAELGQLRRERLAVVGVHTPERFDIESAYRLDGFAIVQENGVTAERDVPHAHVHVIPRHGGDALELGWSGKRLEETIQREVATAVRDELASDG